MKIDIERKRNHIFGIFRTVQVYVDGEKVAMLKVGEKIQLDLERSNLIWVRMDWCRSVKLQLKEDDLNSFVCGEENYIWALLAAFLCPFRALSLRRLK